MARGSTLRILTVLAQGADVTLPTPPGLRGSPPPRERLDSPAQVGVAGGAVVRCAGGDGHHLRCRFAVREFGGGGAGRLVFERFVDGADGLCERTVAAQHDLHTVRGEDVGRERFRGAAEHEGQARDCAHGLQVRLLPDAHQEDAVHAGLGVGGDALDGVVEARGVDGVGAPEDDGCIVLPCGDGGAQLADHLVERDELLLAA